MVTIISHNSSLGRTANCVNLEKLRYASSDVIHHIINKRY